MVLKSEQAKGADFPIPKLPPEAPPLSDTPEAFTKFCQQEFLILSEPVNPVVLKSLILKTLIFSSCKTLIALFIKVKVFLSVQYSLHFSNIFSSSLILSSCFRLNSFKSNSTITGLELSKLASNEF